MARDVIRQAHRMLLLSGCLEFTKKMYEAMNKKPYIVGEHHKLICDRLDDVIKGKTKRLIINIAPRYGKTLLVSQMFIAYGFAVNPKSRFLHLSYSGGLTVANSMAVRDILDSEYFKYLFEARIDSGTRACWGTTEGGSEYATSTLGQITGFGAGRVDNEDETGSPLFNGAIVIDDPIKPEEALSDTIRESVNRRFETTIRNRVNSRNTPIVIIMQRLHEHDLCGYLQEVEPDDWEVLSLPCVEYDEQGNRKALWDFKHSLAELDKLREINEFVFETQYMQNPTPLEGLMYRPFKTYEELPLRVGRVKNYTDSADVGSDYLCSICYVEFPDGLYVTDVLYTKKPMDVTEPQMAKMLMANGVEECVVESNNGGRVFKRNVERISREIGNSKTYFRDFTQTKNKNVRIFSNANEVNNLIYFPVDWGKRWREFSLQVTSFRREGRNLHDDAEDVLTAMVEMRDKGKMLSEDQLLSKML